MTGTLSHPTFQKLPFTQARSFCFLKSDPKGSEQVGSVANLATLSPDLSKLPGQQRLLSHLMVPDTGYDCGLT